MYMPCQFQDDIFEAQWNMNTWIYKWFWEKLFKFLPANWPSTLTIAHGQQTCRNHEKKDKKHKQKKHENDLQKIFKFC